ncbi:MAG: outer membrane beta-barrel protein [Campylobacterales bacterium]|nr:outer membrane beta-barrel protein [Campylobacterales bacterium]
MVKKVTIALLCMTLGSSLQARDISTGEKFLGLEVGAAQIQADTLSELDHEGSSAEFGFRLGVQNEDWRTTLIFDYFDSSDDDQNYEKGMVTVDYYFMGSDNQQTINPYIGLNIGYMNYESTYIDESGFLYGGQVGVTLEVIDNVDIDLGYRYSLTDADQTDHIGSVVLGINYLY